MSDKNIAGTMQKYAGLASLYMNEYSMQWIAALPLLIFASMPLVVFVARLFPGVDFLPYMMLDPLRTVFLVFSGISAIICVYLAVTKKLRIKDIIRGNIPVLFFLAFLLCMLVSYLVIGVPVYDDPFNELGIFHNEGHLMYISFFVVYFFCGSLIMTKQIKTAVLRYFVIVSFIIAFLSVVDYYFVPLAPFRLMWEGSVPGVFNNPNHYGYYITIMTLLSTGMLLYEKDRKWQILGLISSVTHCAVIVINDTFGSYLAIWAGFIFFIVTALIVYKKFPVKLLMPIAALLLFSFVLVSWRGDMSVNFTSLGSDVSSITSNSESAQYAGSSRWILWTSAAEGIMQSPVFGQGVEGWDDILLARSTTAIHAHNEYLQYALFFGIPALVCYVGGIFAIYLRALRNKKKLDGYTLMALTAAFGYCVSAFFGNPKYYTGPFFFMILGLGYSWCSEANGEEKKNDAGDHSSVANS